MNSVTQSCNVLDEMIQDMRQGKIDAATMNAVAAAVKAKTLLVANEIAMARHGKMIDVVSPEWRKRLSQVPAA